MNDITISRRTALKTAFAGLGAAALGGSPSPHPPRPTPRS